MAKATKIGYSNDGGIFMGSGIQSDFHKHHAMVIILSCDSEFEIIPKQAGTIRTKAILIQKDENYKFSGEASLHIFLHIDPYSENGLALRKTKHAYFIPDYSDFNELIPKFKSWYESPETEEILCLSLLNESCNILSSKNKENAPLDSRIKESMQYIKSSKEFYPSLKASAAKVFLSPDRYAHLFKEQTGISYRKYVLHQKLVKAIRAIYMKSNLTQASHLGGFSDQAHFTRTFKKAFGIKPSRSKK